MQASLAACVIVLAALVAPRATATPREAFLRQPVIADVHLSPDGRWLSFARRDARGWSLWLQSVATGQRTKVMANADSATQAWSGDGRRLWVADARGLAVVAGATHVAKRVLRWDARRGQRFFGVDAHAPAFAMVRERIGTRHRYLLADATGKLRLLHESALPLRHVLLAADGSLAYAAAYDGPRWDTVIRQYKPAVRELARCRGIESCVPVGYDGNTLWLLSQNGRLPLQAGEGDKRVLMRWHAAEGWRTVSRDPAGIADADTVLWDDARSDWLAVAYDGAARAWHAQDGATRTRLATLRRHFPDANLHLAVSRDQRTWLVRAERSDWALPRHALFLPARDRLVPLFARDDASVHALPARQLVRATPVQWRASDGMALHGFLYVPRNVARAKAPLVAWLHGGPFSRSDDRFDPRVQLLVDRGCIVFLPNFRASTGHGLRYLRASKGDVGNGRVLRDVIDGLDHLLAQGIGDRAKQAVMGHSFGGYASLLAVTHHPTRFRFALAGAPPVDYGWAKQWQSENESEGLRGDGPPLALSFPQHGLPFADAAWRARMRRDAPLTQLGRVRVPLYLWAGARDDRTPLRSVVHYAGEARRQGKSVVLLVDPSAGHVPRDALGDEAWMYFMERAVTQQFGGTPSPPSPALQAFLQRQVRIDTVARRPGFPPARG
jgi:dipeptidyl aminopeptidase/acylaminoacyl peptidase